MIVLARYTTHSDGYIRVRLDDGRIIGEHRYVMELKVGRKLTPTEHVHHKDEDRTNNAIENLELHTAASHTALHMFCGGETMIPLVCAECGNKFERPKRNVTWHITLGQTRFFCDRSCMGRKLMREMQLLRPSSAKHGTRNMYSCHKCRCEECTTAQNTYMREYHRKHKKAAA